MRLMHFFDFVLAAAAVTSVSAAPGGHGPSNERLQAGDFGSSSIQQFLTAVPVEYRDHEGDAKGTLKVQKRNERLSPAAQARLKRPSYVRMLAGELKRDYPEITDDFAQCMAEKIYPFFDYGKPLPETATLQEWWDECERLWGRQAPVNGQSRVQSLDRKYLRNHAGNPGWTDTSSHGWADTYPGRTGSEQAKDKPQQGSSDGWSFNLFGDDDGGLGQFLNSAKEYFGKGFGRADGGRQQVVPAGPSPGQFQMPRLRKPGL